MSTLLDQFKARLTAKGIKFEESTSITDRPLVGFRFPGKEVYHWFAYMSLPQCGEWMTFVQSYSCNTGEKKEGSIHGVRVAMRVEKLLNMELMPDRIEM